VVLAYHALIELTVGSAAIDAAMVSAPANQRDAAYASWRLAYAGLDAAQFPVSVRLAGALYPGDAASRFEAALDRLLDGIDGDRASGDG
jgi:TetR/AcrR family transcriptional regulator, tetracycline repressor protein